MCAALWIAVSCRIEAGTEISFCIKVKNPAQPQQGPDTMTIFSSDGNSYQDLEYSKKLLSLPYASMEDPRPMYIRSPEFKMLEIEQSSPFPLDQNTIQLSFKTNVPLLSRCGSALSIRGLEGSVSPSSKDFSMHSLSNDTFGRTAEWNREGTLAIQSRNDTSAGQLYKAVVVLKNQKDAQDARAVDVTTSGVFIDWMRAEGDEEKVPSKVLSRLCSWKKDPQANPMSAGLHHTGQACGIGDAMPLKMYAPEFLVAAIKQSTEWPGATNELTVDLVANTDLSGSTLANLTVSKMDGLHENMEIAPFIAGDVRKGAICGEDPNTAKDLFVTFSVQNVRERLGVMDSENADHFVCVNVQYSYDNRTYREILTTERGRISPKVPAVPLNCSTNGTWYNSTNNQTINCTLYNLQLNPVSAKVSFNCSGNETGRSFEHFCFCSPGKNGTSSRLGSLTKMITYQSPYVSSLGVTNAVTAGAYSLTIYGSRFGSGLSMLTGLELGSADFSPLARIGLTACENTRWISDTSLHVQHPNGVSSSLEVVASLGAKMYTSMPVFTFNSAVVTDIASQNANQNTSAHMTIHGMSFGFSDYSARAILGTATEVTVWSSDTALSAVPAAGVFADVAVIVSVGAHVLDGLGFAGCNICYQYNALTNAWSYDSVVLDDLAPPNGGSSGGFALTILGQQFGLTDFSPKTRLGGTACEFSQWMSSSAVLCSSPPGENNQRVAAVTIYSRFSTRTKSFTYDELYISAVHPRNGPKSGDTAILVIGQNLKVTDSSPLARLHETACKASAWVSDSVITCLISAGNCIDRDVVATVGAVQHTVYSSFSHDTPMVSALKATTNGASNVAVISVLGSNFAATAVSASVRIGGTPTVSIRWTSDSSIVAGVPNGARVLHAIVITVGCNATNSTDAMGTLSNAFSYDAPVIAAAVIVNASNLDDQTLASNLAGSSTPYFLMTGRSFPWVSYSLSARISGTSAEHTEWYSDSSAVGRAPTPAYSTLADGSVAITVGGLGKLTQVYTFDGPQLSALSQFVDCTSCDMLTLAGAEFKSVDSSVQARLRGLPCQASVWTSDSSVSCKVPGNSLGLSVASDSGAVITVQGQLASLTKSLTYTQPTIASANISTVNSPATGKTSITVVGSRFGSGLSFLYGLEVGAVDSSVQIRAGGTACESTDWISDSSLSAKMAAGFDQQIGLVVSVGSTKQSGLQVMTYDAAAVSAVAQITNCTSCNSLTLLGTSFAEVDTTPKARLGGLPCQAAQWASDSSVHCRIAANSLTLSNSSDSGVVITVLGRLGSITETLDYSLPNITSVHDTNSPLSGKVSITVSGAQFGAGLSFLLGIEVGIADWSLATRVGGSACESTDWISDSSLHVKLAQGFGSEHAIVVSLVKLYVSGRQALTYSAPQVVAGSAMSLNFGLGNVVNVTFSGDSFGNFAVSLTTRQGMTAAEQTSWLSSTSLTAHIPAGFRGTLQSIVTTGAAFGSITDAISYDHVPIRGPSANISHPSANFPSHPAQSIIVTALNLSPFERSVRLRVSFSAMESTLWLSDTCTQGRHPVGVASTRTTVLTAGLQSGSITDVVSYDSTLIRNFNGTSNVPANSAQVVTVHGRNLMLSDESHATRFGNTACESSDWLSDTSLYCKTTVGLFGSQKTSVTAGASFSTATMLGTYDNAGIVYVKASTQEIAQNIPPVPQNQSISLAGYNFGGYDVCSALRSGSTANPATFWTSDTAVAARVALGMGTLSGVSTAGRKAGSISSVFTFDAPLTSSLKPGNAMASGLGTITMAGDNFLLNDLTGAGRIGGTSCQATEWTSSTSLKCRLSPGIHPQLGLLATAGSPGLAAGSLTLAFSYSAPSTSGSTVVNAPSLGGGTITLHGSSFGAFDYSQRIRIGGTACTASQWQLDGAVVCKTPGGSGLNRQVVMTTGGQIGTLTGLFTFNLPSVNQIFPGNLPTTGGTTLTMVGGEFGNADVAQVIKVGGTPCLTTVYFSDSSLHCLSPAGVGSIPTLEVFSAGLSGIGRNLLSYDTPSISAISPSNDAVSGGRTISIFGAGFGTAPYVFTNYTAQGSINGTLTNVTGFHSDSSIMMSAPAGIGKSLPALVTVATQVGQITGAFSYDLPVVTDFYPRNSPTKGGITVTVNGFNLGDNRRHVHTARLLSGHYSGTMVNDYQGTVIGTPSFTTLVMVIGVGAGVNKSLQVTVAEQSGQSLLPVAFNFDAPNITLVFPNFGGTLGGDTLSVIGNNFGPGLPPNGGPVVISYHDAAGFPGECASISEGADPHTLLHGVTNRGAGQGFNLTVNIDTQVATSLAAFSYAAPIVVAMTPNFSPAAGGGTVTLFGSNFGIMDYQTSGQIGITLCPSVTWFADSQVRCIVPAGIGGGLSVAVGSDGQYGSRADLFSYSAPKLNSVFPTSGPTSGGIDLTVSGVNFGTSSIYQSNLSASVGGRASSQATFVSDTSMVIGIPVGGGSQVVQVFVAGQPSDLVVPFHYNPPIVTAVTPRNGLTLGGTLLRVFGSNFGPVDTSPFVSLGLATGTYCTNNIWTSDTAMTTVSPPGKSFPHDVFVSIPGFAVSTGSLIGGWSYDVPTLTAISPGNAPTSGAVSVTILGKNLVVPPTLTIGNTASTSVTIVSDTAITLVAPAGVGVGHAITGTFDGDPSFGSLEFTYDAPVITHIDPRNGPTNGGDFVTIRGKNFGKSSEIGQVSASIGNTACTSVGAVTDHVAVKCETSGGYGIALAVQVTVASQLSNVDQVFSYDIPVITAVAPNVAETVTSTTVTILGRNFGDSSAGRSARIGNTLCSTVSFISFSALGCTVEPGLGAQLDVLVQVDIVSGSTANIFSYYAPQLASLQRANGPPTGGTTTTVSGSHFGIYDSNVVAQIDARACSPKLWTSDSSILCGVPANIGKDKTFSLGVVGQSVSSFQGFSYNAPILTSITPATSPTSGATSSPVTLHGFNFGASDPASAASAKIGSTFSPTVTWLSDNQIRATVPDGEGIAHSSYITIAGQSSLLAAAFSYEPPSITALIYTTSDTDGGNTITVLGTNFGSTAAVQSATIGSTAAGVTYNSHIVTLLTTPPGTGKALRVSMDISGQPGNYSSCGRPECIAGAFSYTAPSITHVTPKYGAAAGGTQVTLYGSNFGQGLAAETGASIHGLSCASATWVSSTSMTCASAPNAFISNRTLACVECNAHSVTAQVIINELVGTLPNAFSYTNDGSNAGSAALWCSAAKVAFASNTDGMLYIDPDGDGDTSDAYQVFCFQQQDGGGWTKIVQYDEDAYTPTSGAAGFIATQMVGDGKLSDEEIDMIGGKRVLLNVGSVIGGSRNSFSLFDNVNDDLPLSRLTGRYVGLSITIGAESRVITSYVVANPGANPAIVVSPDFVALPTSGATYEIYSPTKEYLLFGVSFTGLTDNVEEPMSGLGPYVPGCSRLQEPGMSSLPTISVLGPQQIGPCDDVVVRATVSSASRPLTFTWECHSCNCGSLGSKTAALCKKLSTITSSVLSLDSSDFSVANMQYEIAVTGNNFMGISSKPSSLTIFKSRLPMPIVSFVYMPSYSCSDAISIKAKAEFSSCQGTEEGELHFAWRQIAQGGHTDGAVPLEYLSRDSSSLWIQHFFRNEMCGDGLTLGAEVEMVIFCDDGNNAGGDGASSCGDGYLAPDETCDDGNNEVGDGCSSTCSLEYGWECSTLTCGQSVCTEPCGNSLVSLNEGCHDGGAVLRGGCQSSQHVLGTRSLTGVLENLLITSLATHHMGRSNSVVAALTVAFMQIKCVASAVGKDVEGGEDQEPQRMDETMTVVAAAASAHTGQPFGAVDVPPDGSCFYHAITAILRMQGGATITSSGLRDQVADFLNTNPRLQEMDNSGMEWDEVADQTRNGAWANEFAVQATATLLQSTITLYTAGGHVTSVAPFGTEILDNPQSILTAEYPRQFHLGYIEQTHYFILARPGEEEQLREAGHDTTQPSPEGRGIVSHQIAGRQAVVRDMLDGGRPGQSSTPEMNNLTEAMNNLLANPDYGIAVQRATENPSGSSVHHNQQVEESLYERLLDEGQLDPANHPTSVTVHGSTETDVVSDMARDSRERGEAFKASRAGQYGAPCNTMQGPVLAPKAEMLANASVTLLAEHLQHVETLMRNPSPPETIPGIQAAVARVAQLSLEAYQRHGNQYSNAPPPGVGQELTPEQQNNVRDVRQHSHAVANMLYANYSMGVTFPRCPTINPANSVVMSILASFASFLEMPIWDRGGAFGEHTLGLFLTAILRGTGAVRNAVVDIVDILFPFPNQESHVNLDDPRSGGQLDVFRVFKALPKSAQLLLAVTAGALYNTVLTLRGRHIQSHGVVMGAFAASLVDRGMCAVRRDWLRMPHVQNIYQKNRRFGMLDTTVAAFEAAMTMFCLGHGGVAVTFLSVLYGTNAVLVAATRAAMSVNARKGAETRGRALVIARGLNPANFSAAELRSEGMSEMARKGAETRGRASVIARGLNPADFSDAELRSEICAELARAAHARRGRDVVNSKGLDPTDFSAAELRSESAKAMSETYGRAQALAQGRDHNDMTDGALRSLGMSAVSQHRTSEGMSENARKGAETRGRASVIARGLNPADFSAAELRSEGMSAQALAQGRAQALAQGRDHNDMTDGALRSVGMSAVSQHRTVSLIASANRAGVWQRITTDGHWVSARFRLFEDWIAAPTSASAGVPKKEDAHRLTRLRTEENHGQPLTDAILNDLDIEDHMAIIWWRERQQRNAKKSRKGGKKQ